MKRSNELRILALSLLLAMGLSCKRYTHDTGGQDSGSNATESSSGMESSNVNNQDPNGGSITTDTANIPTPQAANPTDAVGKSSTGGNQPEPVN